MEATEGDGAGRDSDREAADSGPKAVLCPIRGDQACMGAACAWAARQGGRWVCGVAACGFAGSTVLARTVSRWGEERACGR